MVGIECHLARLRGSYANIFFVVSLQFATVEYVVSDLLSWIHYVFCVVFFAKFRCELHEFFALFDKWSCMFFVHVAEYDVYFFALDISRQVPFHFGHASNDVVVLVLAQRTYAEGGLFEFAGLFVNNVCGVIHLLN